MARRAAALPSGRISHGVFATKTQRHQDRRSYIILAYIRSKQSVMNSFHASLADIVVTNTSIALLRVLVPLWREIRVRPEPQGRRQPARTSTARRRIPCSDFVPSWRVQPGLFRNRSGSRSIPLTGLRCAQIGVTFSTRVRSLPTRTGKHQQELAFIPRDILANLLPGWTVMTPMPRKD